LTAHAGRLEGTEAAIEEADSELRDEELEQELEYARPAPAAEDDEPEEDFSDWNVPSWNDLIASLYRPDR
jgi:hypothetical protein